MSVVHRLKSKIQKRALTRPELANMFEAPTQNAYVAIDCEMTGLNAKKNHLLSIAAVHINGNQIDTGGGQHLICRPPVMPEEDTIIIHGLRPYDVANGLSYDAMLDIILPFIGARPIVGFCPQLDLAFLNPLTKAYMGTTLPNEVIDIRDLYNRRTGNRTAGVTHSGQHLDNIIKSYNIPNLGSHNAYNDAVMTAMAFFHLR